MSHHNEPPGLPVVTDEAADSPRWLPLVGLALLGALLLVLAVERATGGGEEAVVDEAPPAEPAAAAQAEGAEEAPGEPAAIPLE